MTRKALFQSCALLFMLGVYGIAAWAQNDHLLKYMPDQRCGRPGMAETPDAWFEGLPRSV
jgi:hypothetical protein